MGSLWITDSLILKEKCQPSTLAVTLCFWKVHLGKECIDVGGKIIFPSTHYSNWYLRNKKQSNFGIEIPARSAKQRAVTETRKIIFKYCQLHAVLGLHQLVVTFGKDVYHPRIYITWIITQDVHTSSHLIISQIYYMFLGMYGSRNQMTEMVRYDLSYSFTDTIIGNCSDTPSLWNSKTNPLIINIESQRHNCKGIIIMFILCRRMATLCLAPLHLLCLVYKASNRKEKDPPGRWVTQISVMDT